MLLDLTLQYIVSSEFSILVIIITCSPGLSLLGPGLISAHVSDLSDLLPAT